MRQSTEDTKRALAIIQPLAKELRLNVSADGDFLYVDGQGIGISCNSTYATVMEFVGFVFLNEYNKRFRDIALSPKQTAALRRFFYTPEQIEQLSRREQ